MVHRAINNAPPVGEIDPLAKDVAAVSETTLDNRLGVLRATF
jgi:hypothetical protein